MAKLLRFTGKDLQDIDMNSLLEGKPTDLQPIALKWLTAIKNSGPEVEQIFHDNYPIGCVDEAPFVYVNVFAAHVNVGFFYGVDLQDPKGLLEGTGKRMRHIKLKTNSNYADEDILLLLQHAYLDIAERLAKE